MSYVLSKNKKDVEHNDRAFVVAENSSVESRSSAFPMFQLVFVCVIIVAAYFSWSERFYTRESDFAYYLGIVGGVLMLVLFMYPIRKHFPRLTMLGPVRAWFRLHMFCGVAGPLFVLFHATFKTGSVNASFALGSMLLVAGSGFIGRFIYTRIHHGLYGRKATLGELQSGYSEHMQAIAVIQKRFPPIESQLGKFVAHAQNRTGSPFWVSAKTLLLGYEAWRTILRCKRIFQSQIEVSAKDVIMAYDTLRHYVHNIVRIEQFSLFERLFRMWHVLHVPFVLLLILSSVVHIIAVHLY